MPSGFTLIELLVVIAVLGILISGIIYQINPGNQINKAQDTRRAQDVNQLKLALDSYYNDKNCYPTSLDSLSTGNNPYIKNLPKDPDTNTAYGYAFEGGCSQWYTLFAKLKAGNAAAAADTNCTLPKNCGTTVPTGLDGTWLCKSSGKVNCSLVSSVTLSSSGVVVPTSPPPVLTAAPTQGPSPTPHINPNPVLVGSATTGSGSGPSSVFVSGNYAYVVNEASATLQKFDITPPTNPVLVGSATTGTGSAPTSVFVLGNYAYVVNRTNALQKFDITPPTNPVLVGSVATGDYSNSVFVSGNYAYVTNGSSNTLQKFDITSATNPVLVGSVTTGGFSTSVFISGNYAYVVNDNVRSLQKFDITPPTNPVLVGSASTANYPTSVFVSGDYAYVSNNGATLQKFYIGSTNPALMGSAVGGGYNISVFVSGDYAYAANYAQNKLEKFDIRPNSPLSVGSATTGSGPRSVFVSGNYAYVVSGSSNTLQKFDLNAVIAPVTPGNCIDGTTDQTYAGSSMVGCNGTVTFGQASGLCATDSHLCSIDEYLAKGGKTTPTNNSGNRWLESRSTTTPTLPTCDTDQKLMQKGEAISNMSFLASPVITVSYVTSCSSQNRGYFTRDTHTFARQGATCCAGPAPSVAPTIDPSYCITGYRDYDNDSFTIGAGERFCGMLALPGGYRQVKSNYEDCYDGNINAFPNQTQYFAGHRGDGSFDYNCDGVIETKKPCSNASLAIDANPTQTKPTSGSDYMTWCAGSVTRDNAGSLCVKDISSPCATTYYMKYGGTPADYWVAGAYGGGYSASSTGWCGCSKADQSTCTIHDVHYTSSVCRTSSPCTYPDAAIKTVIQNGIFIPITSSSVYGFVTTGSQQYGSFRSSSNACPDGTDTHTYVDEFGYIALKHKDTQLGALCCSSTATVSR